MSGAIGIILRTVILVALLFMLVLFAWIGGTIIDPFIEVVLQNEAAQAAGYDRGLEIAFRIGLALVLPLLGLAALIYVHAAQLQTDHSYRRF